MQNYDSLLVRSLHKSHKSITQTSCFNSVFLETSVFKSSDIEDLETWKLGNQLEYKITNKVVGNCWSCFLNQPILELKKSFIVS